MNDNMTHFMSTVKVGPKGQIVIPKEIRDMFQIGPGENLVIMANSQKGIVIHKQSVMESIAKAIFDGKGEELYPKEDAQDLSHFADAIKEATTKGVSKK